MTLKASYATNPLLLLLCAVAGALLGLGPPAMTTSAWLVVYVSTALLNLVCMPLLVVATLSGLRHLLGLPHPLRRLLMIALAGGALLLLCAQLGVLVANWGQLGWQLDEASQLELGQLVISQAASGDTLKLESSGTSSEIGTRAPWTIPNNAFLALSSGDLAAVMFCTLVFGLAFTSQKGSLSDSTVELLDAVSRTLEKLIGMVNLAVPLLVMAYAAQITSQWNPGLLRAMGSFLIGFWALSGLLSVIMVLALVKLGTSTTGQVLQALKIPVVLSLVSASPLASVPASIDSLSNRLGFSRGVVEMLLPSSTVFLRTGAALQYAMLAVFVAHLYGHQLTPMELVTLAPVAVVAALASAGSSGVASLGFAAMVVTHLKLPYEAALPLFAAIQLLNEGPTRLLSMLCSCVLTAIVCGGLPMERRVLNEEVKQHAPLRLTLSHQSAVVLASCVSLTGLLCLVLGIGLGLRQADSRTPFMSNTTSLPPAAVPGLTP
jgi:aerobic C4-dicarboxylate transport protein